MAQANGVSTSIGSKGLADALVSAIKTYRRTHEAQLSASGEEWNRLDDLACEQTAAIDELMCAGNNVVVTTDDEALLQLVIAYQLSEAIAPDQTTTASRQRIAASMKYLQGRGASLNPILTDFFVLSPKVRAAGIEAQTA